MSDAGEPITLCTSISPARREHQQRCLASWRAAGFEIVSLNRPTEIAALEPSFPGIRFVATRRDGSPHVQRAVPFIYDAIDELASRNGRHLGLVNSDIQLCEPELRARLLGRPEGSLAIGQRIDVDTPEGVNPQPQDCGIDLFVFDRSFLRAIDLSPFFFGVPWWDYWLPTAAALAGIEVARLEHGPLRHVRHAQGWSYDSWLRGARALMSFVDARWPARAAPWNDDASRALRRLASLRRAGGAPPGHEASSIVRDFVIACPVLARPERDDDTCASVSVREQMGYTVERLLPGVSSHNNDVRPFQVVPSPLLGKAFTQVVSSCVTPVEVTFQTPGRIFVLAGTDWDGGRAMIRQLASAGHRTAIAPLAAASYASFEVFALRGATGDRVVFPTQVMIAAGRISHDGGPPPAGAVARPRGTAPANEHARVLVSAARERCGAFSMFFQVLGHLRLAEEQRMIPVVYFNRHVCFWTDAGQNGSRNAWEYFFHPVGPLGIDDVYPDPRALEALDSAGLRRQLADRAVVRDDYLAHEVGFGGRMDARQRAIAADMVARYIRPRTEVLAQVDEFFARELAGRPVVGVHYRGTDKHIESASPPFERYREQLDAALARAPATRIFVATDCAHFLARLKATYADRVIHTGAHRSPDGRPIHFGYAAGAGEVIVDALLLARTSHLFHGVSNVSAAALAFDGGLPHTELG